jgi:quinol monooxygenase YgiN
MPEGPFRVVARFKAMPGKSDEVREVLKGLVEPTRKETGCLVYELLQNTKDPSDFTFVEEWKNDEAFDSHTSSDHIKALGTRLNGLVIGIPDIGVYSVVA